MRVNRYASDKILRLLNLFPVVVLVGVRQAGKTTLVRGLMPEWRYMDLETSSHFDLIQHDPALFLKQNPKQVIFDEAQGLPALFSELRHAVDQDRDRKGRYLLTGSSSPALIRQISETLAGRAAMVEIGTFKLGERFCISCSPLYRCFELGMFEPFDKEVEHPSHSEVLQHWFSGGYPEPTLSQDPYFTEIWFEEYIRRYLERDLHQQFPGLNATRYRRFISLLANLTAHSLNQSDLARTLEVSSPTIKDYLNIAEGTFLWRNLLSFERNVAKAVVKMPKGFIRDSGLVHALLKLGSIEQLQAHPLMGYSFEAFVIEEILKGIQLSKLASWSAHYYRTRAKTEIDLIIDSKHGPIPIEVKYSSRIDERLVRILKNFMSHHRSPFGLLVNNSERIEDLGEGLYQLPAWYL